MSDNNKGFSLVELMIALAVSAIVILGANLMLSTSNSSYTREKTRIDLQQEAQLAGSMISNLLLEASDAEELAGGGATVILRIYETPSGSAVKFTDVYLDSSQKKLFVNKGVSDSSITYSYQQQELASNVKDFNYLITGAAIAGRRTASFSMEMESESGQTYHLKEKSVLMRNSGAN